MRSLAVWKTLGLMTAGLWTLAWSVGCSGSDHTPPEDDPQGSVSWCQVSQVLASKCQRCHVGEGLFGAPFPLVTFEDTQVLSPTTGKQRWEQMEVMVTNDLMPPNDPRLDPPPEKLSASEKALLLTWFEERAKSVGGTTCR